MNTNFNSSSSIPTPPPTPPSLPPEQRSSFPTAKSKQATFIKVYTPAAHFATHRDAFAKIEVSAQDTRGWLTKFMDLFRGKSVVQVRLSNQSTPVYAKTDDLANALGISKKDLLSKEGYIDQIIRNQQDVFEGWGSSYRSGKAYQNQQKQLAKEHGLDSIASGQAAKVKEQITLRAEGQKLKESIEKDSVLNPATKGNLLKRIDVALDKLDQNDSTTSIKKELQSTVAWLDLAKQGASILTDRRQMLESYFEASKPILPLPIAEGLSKKMAELKSQCDQADILTEGLSTKIPKQMNDIMDILTNVGDLQLSLMRDKGLNAVKASLSNQLENLNFSQSSLPDIEAGLKHLHNFKTGFLSLKQKLDDDKTLKPEEKESFLKRAENLLNDSSHPLSTLSERLDTLTKEARQTIESTKMKEGCQKLQHMIKVDKTLDEAGRTHLLNRLQQIEAKVAANPSSALQESTKQEFAQLEQEVSKAVEKERHAAATKIQKIFRGFRARNQLVQNYVEKHFEIRSNIPQDARGKVPLSQAKVIYMGETHNIEEHALRNAWLIKHMYKKGDRVLVEDQSKATPWIKPPTEENLTSQLRYVQKEIEVWGWDLKSDKLSSALNNTFTLGGVLNLYEKFNTAAEADKRPIFDQMIAQLKAIKIADNKGTFSSVRSNLLNNAVLLDKAFQERPKELLAYLIGASFADNTLYTGRMIDETFAERQHSLTGKVSAEIQPNKNEYRKIFLIAGQAHLVKKGAVEKDLAPSLKNHKYVLLIPKTSTKSVDEQDKIQKLLAKRLAQQKSPTGPKKTSNTEQDQRAMEFYKGKMPECLNFRLWCAKNFPAIPTLSIY